MTERAALYTVAVRPRAKRGNGLPLGDIDGAGTSLSSVLAGILDGFAETSADGARVVRALVARPDGEDLFAVVQHGQKGVAADIVGPAGTVRLRQTPDDLELVRCGCLFRLPATESLGRLAVQINDGRGIKGLFEQGLIARFRASFPHLTLAIDRLAEPDALREAVAADRVEELRLVRVEPEGDRSIADTAKWVGAGTAARLELGVAARAQGERIDRRLLERYLGGDQDAFAEIVEFAGMTFDQAKVGVVLPDQSRRFFDLEHPETGRPVWKPLAGIALDADGEPTEASLAIALRSVLGE